MANRNRMYNDNRRNNNFNRNNSGGGMGGYGRQMSPWQGGMAPGGNLQGGSMPTSTEATLALANNLISNLLQTRDNPVPSLLDINVRRGGDYGGANRMNNYGNSGYMERRNMGRMGARDMHMGNRSNFVSHRGPDGGIRKPQRPNNQHNKGSKQHANKQTSAKKEKPATDAKIQSAESSGDQPAGDEQNAAADDENAKKEGTLLTQYDDIPAELLECHICEKKMWDGRSFDNHINGRAHHIMMDKTRESYRMTADAMRQELRITEMRRDRKMHPMAKKVLCAMCDLYVVMGGAHRRSLGHQKLKKYLHPSCNTCRKEMPTRIELDEHRLTVQHMKMVQEKLRETLGKPKQEVMTMSTLQDELLLVRTITDANNKRNTEKKEEGQEQTSDTPTTEDVVKTEVEEEENKEAPPPEELVYTILEYQEGDDLSDMTRKNLPRYSSERPVGTGYISDFSCKQCTLCKKLFDCEEAAEVHARTFKHFNAFCKLLRSKGNFKNIVKYFKVKGEDDTLKRKPDESDGDMNDNSKRVKLENGDQSVDESSTVDTSMPITEEENWDSLNNVEEAINETSDFGTIDESVLDDEPSPVEEKREPSPPAPVSSPTVNRGRGRGARGRRGGIASNRNKI